VLSRQSVYGTYYTIEGTLTGPTGMLLGVTTVWLVDRQAGGTRFITAFPTKSPRRRA
jgi:hypothetical protein